MDGLINIEVQDSYQSVIGLRESAKMFESDKRKLFLVLE